MSKVTLPLPQQIADGQVNDAAPVMANFNYIADQVNSATDFGNAALTGNALVALASTVVLQNSFMLNDVNSEWSGGVNARFIPSNTGIYSIEYTGFLNASSADLTQFAVCQLIIFKNGSAIVPAALTDLAWPFTGTVSASVPLAIKTTLSLALGDYIDARVFLPTFSTGTVFYSGFVAIRRVS